MLAAAGIRNFAPVLIKTDNPEDARQRIAGPCDVFLCLGVFQALPTPEYGYRVLDIAYDLMAPGGLAIIQIKYIKRSWATKPKRFGYNRNYPILTSYALDEFWIEAQQKGFEPKCITLVPRHPINGDGEYAYFLLRKPSASAAVSNDRVEMMFDSFWAARSFRSREPGSRAIVALLRGLNRGRPLCLPSYASSTVCVPSTRPGVALPRDSVRS